MQFFIDPYFPDDINAVGDAGMAGFDEKRQLYFSGCKNFLGHYREEIKKQHAGGASGSQIVGLISDMMDELNIKLFQSILYDVDGGRMIDHITLIAVGGYGRGELNPFSDIDIMFLHDGTMAVDSVENVALKLLYLLWDMKMDVGYSVRTIADCTEMAAADSTVKTALMDMHFLCGNRQLFDALHKAVFAQLLTKSSDKFIKEKITAMNIRREKYGSTVYLLEPNLKEGEGGLRDLQTAMWAARVKFKFTRPKELIIKGLLTEEELETYFAALDYLWRLRNELHYFSGRKNDQLNFEAQVHLAEFMGYKDHGKTLAVEDFMRDYYRQANRAEHFSSMLISRCVWRDEGALKILGYFVRRPVGEGCFVLKGELIVPDETVVVKKPVILIRIFEFAQKHGVDLNVRVKALLRKNLHLIDDDFRSNREVNLSFLTILRSPKDVVKTLRLMHHLEFLNHYIPEFENIYCKVQHDIYHIYTVDIHTLFAIEEAEKMLNGQSKELLPLPCSVAETVGKRELLILAVMFHDIGKGTGGGHSEKGAAMVPAIAKRIGLSKEDTERLVFLVQHHLLFPHIAQRRDLRDEQMIIQFSKQMVSSENLKMLFLLTIADVRAVGSDVWSTWKAQLFYELYEKTFNVLERGGFQQEARSERVKEVIRKVAAALEDDFRVAIVREELRAMPVRFLLSNTLQVITEHTRLLLALDVNQIQMHLSHQKERGYSEFTICTRDKPGLFSQITGVMAANGANILGAEINTSQNGKVLDILQLNSSQGELITDGRRWDTIQNQMYKVLQDQFCVAELVEKRHRPSLLTVRPSPRFPTRVEIDNQVSEGYTVIDIYTHDKVGLLYLITSTLTLLGLYIGVSRISTKVDQVADVFYVRETDGGKILSEERLTEITDCLKKAIDEWE